MLLPARYSRLRLGTDIQARFGRQIGLVRIISFDWPDAMATASIGVYKFGIIPGNDITQVIVKQTRRYTLPEYR